MQVISVIRDFKLYNQLVKENLNWGNATFIAIDNRTENKTIPVRYNAFLDAYDYSNPDWFVFCHEDWELKEELSQILASLDKNALYGPIGRVKNYAFCFCKENIGQILESNKDGTDVAPMGIPCPQLRELGTFDCQCLIVHSTLIEKYHFRFDEALTFDLYVEDFCIQAYERASVPSMCLQLCCQHYSRGILSERFYKQYRYLQTKWKKAKSCYITTCSIEPIGNYHILLRVVNCLKPISEFFFKKKVTKSGATIVKICKLPVYRKRNK